MRRAILLALLLLPASCSMFQPSGQRFVVFFPDSGVALDDDAAKQVVVNAAAYALDHPDLAIRVDGFADKNGPADVNTDITRSRVQNVIKALASNGIPVARIARREVGEVPFTLDSQESRRVTIVVGQP
jgi:outer membrane protein OmpA-like peptidoglycan-associated protein